MGLEAVNLIVSIAVLLLWLGLLSWVFGDANENGQIGCLWVIIVAIFSLIGLAVYLIFFRGVASKEQHYAIRGQDDADSKTMANYRAYENKINRIANSG